MESQRLVQAADCDVEAGLQVQHRGSSSKVVGIAAAVGLLCAGGWAGSHLAGQRGQITASLQAVQGLVREESGNAHKQIIAKPERGSCSTTKDDCFATGCCNVAGYTCYGTKPGKASCLKNCTPSALQACDQPQSIMNPILQDAMFRADTLFCFAVYTWNTGTTKPSHELEILQYQHSNNLGMFTCDQYDVFSDVHVEVGPGLSTIQVHDVEGDWHFAKRKVSGAWVNTGMFTQVWKAVAQDGKFWKAAWTAKVDADAVFVPSRLRTWVLKQRVPDAGVYLENCKFVDYGYFGNLEVFSQAAFGALLFNIDMCKATLNWKVGIKNGKYGPMGEDLFAQKCLGKLGVRRVEAFDITTDGACPADRPHAERKNKKWKPDCTKAPTAAFHPFKVLDEWISCHSATVDAFGK